MSQTFKLTPQKKSRQSQRSFALRCENTYLRNLPSTNPIRAPTPDNQPRHERIQSTLTPNGVSYHGSSSKKQRSVSPYSEEHYNNLQTISKQFTKVISEKNEMIFSLQQQQQMQSNCSQLIRQVENLNEELKKAREKEISLTFEANNYKDQLSKMCDFYQKQGKQTEFIRSSLRTHEDLQNKQEKLYEQNKALLIECEKLNEIIKSLENQLQLSQSNDFQQIIKEKNQQIDVLMNKYGIQSEQIFKKDQQIIQQASQIQQLEQENNILKEKNKISSVECSTIYTNNEIEKLKLIVDAKDKEILNYKNQIKEININMKASQQKSSPDQELVRNITLLTTEIDKLTSHLNAKNEEFNTLQKRFNEELAGKQSKSLQLGVECEKLAQIVRKQADEIQQLKKKQMSNEQKNQETIDLITRKNVEIEEWKNSYINLEKQKEKEINDMIKAMKSNLQKSSSQQNLQENFDKLKEKTLQLTVEIEKLTKLQIEKEAEYKQRIISLESQIKKPENQQSQFESKLIQYENKIVLLSTEIEKNKYKIAKKEEEIRNKDEQILLLQKTKIESSPQKQISNNNNEAVYENTIRYMHEKITLFETESQKNVLEIQRNQTEIQKLKQDVQRYQQEIARLNIVISQNTTLQQQYENEIQKLNVQINNLNKSVVMLQKESENQQVENETLKHNKKTSQQENNNQIVVNYVLALARIQSLDLIIDQLAKTCEMLNQQLSLKEQEILKIQHQLLEALNNESKSLQWKEKIEKLELQRIQELQGMKNDIEQFKNLTIDPSSTISDAERTAYSTQIKQLQVKVVELDENLKIKQQENYEIKEKNAILIREKENLQLIVTDFKKKNNDVEDLKAKYDIQVKRLESRISQYEIHIQSLTQELLKANEILEQQQKQQKSYEKVDIKIENYPSQDYNQQKLQMMANEIEQLIIARDMYKQQSERKSLELAQKNKLLIQKIEQLDNIQATYQSSLNNIRNLEMKLIEKLQQEEVIIQ